MAVSGNKVVKFNYTEGNIYRALFVLALPATATTFIRSLHSIYDAWLIGRGTASHLAALTGASFFLWMTYAFVSSISIGANALVARFVGSDEPENLSITSMSAVIGGGIFSVFLGSLLFSLAGPTTAILGFTDETALYAENYLRIIFLGLPFIYSYNIIEAIFRGTGDTRTPFILLALLLVTHFVLAPIFVYGGEGVKPMFLKGLALSMVTAHALGCIAGGAILIKRNVINIRLGLRIHLGWLWEMVRIGLPLAVAGAFFSAIYIGVSRIMILFGDAGMASLGVGHRVESISYMTAVGFSQATAALVGQNLGAGKPERAESSVWKSVIVISGFAGAVTVVFLLFNHPLARFFTSDPQVVEYCREYLVIVAISQIFMGISIVLDGAFGGSGDTFVPMLIKIPTTLLRIPISYAFAVTMGMGPKGIFWAITITTILTCLIETAWFLRGNWKIKLDKRLRKESAANTAQ